MAKVSPAPTTLATQRPRSGGASLARRVLAWFLLSLMGNIGILTIAVVLISDPFALPWDEIIANIANAAAPLYSPTLLFFTAILGVISALYPSALARGRTALDVGAAEEDAEQAERLIARVVQLALTFVLSFASVVILHDAAQVAYVLFAALLGFITFALAERIAPPPPVTPEERFRSAQAYLDRIQGWAAADLGADWRNASIRGWWMILIAIVVVPIALPLIVISAMTFVFFGPEFALNPTTLTIYSLSMFGTLTLVLSWLASADKADPPRPRFWRSVFLHLLSAAATVTLSLTYFLEGQSIWWVGLGILTSGAIAVAILYLPRPRWLREGRLRVQRRLTAPRLRLAEKARDEAQLLWTAASQEGARTGVIGHLFRRAFRRNSCQCASM